MSTGAFVDLEFCFGRIEGHQDNDMTFIRIDEHSAEGKVADAYRYFLAKKESQEWFASPMYYGRKIRVVALKYDAERLMLRLKVQAEPLTE